MVAAGAASAGGQEGRAAAGVDQAAAHNGIRWRTRAGTPWRDVPERYGPWDRVYDLFRRWQRNGTWHQVLEQLQADADAKGLITWDVSVDSTVCRAHQHAAGARKRGTFKGNRPAASSPNPTIMASDVPAAV